MKVALLSYDFAEYCIQQANGLAGECEVLLMLPEDSACEYESLLDPAVCFRPFKKPRLRQPVRQVAAARSLVRQINRFRPDVIHFQNGNLWFNFALPWLRSYPLVVTIHNPRHHVGDRASRKTPQWVLDFGFRRADRVIVHGETLKREVVETLSIPSHKIHDIPHVTLGPLAAPPSLEDESPRILFFGRIWKYKGLEHLIAAQPLVNAAFPGAKIVIAGEGDDFAPYRRTMQQPERFEIHNRYITAAERDVMFRQASIVVLPYIEATQSGVIPFAYAYAKPVVATRVGAIPDAVDDGVTGTLIEPRDPRALADAIIGLLGDPARRQAMGRAGREKLDRECSPRVVGKHSLEVYRAAIRSHAGEPAARATAAGNPVVVH
jgi:glycosyltransferase involved in cell wall biosynthesis